MSHRNFLVFELLLCLSQSSCRSWPASSCWWPAWFPAICSWSCRATVASRQAFKLVHNVLFESHRSQSVNGDFHIHYSYCGGLWEVTLCFPDLRIWRFAWTLSLAPHQLFVWVSVSFSAAVGWQHTQSGQQTQRRYTQLGTGQLHSNWRKLEPALWKI